MPPKPKGGRAMTGAERVRKHRERTRAARPPLTDRQKLAQARAEIGRLRNELAAAPREAPAKAPPALQELAEMRAEIERLRAENIGLRRQAKPEIASDLDAVEIQKRKLEYEYEVRAHKLENEYIARLERQARDSVRPVQISDDVQIEVNRWLELLLPELHKERSKARKAVVKRKRILSKATLNKLRFVAHSDTGRHASDKQRDTATQILNELTPYVLDEADAPTEWGSDLPNDLAGWAKRLHDAELKRRMRDVPQPKGMPLPPFLDPNRERKPRPSGRG